MNLRSLHCAPSPLLVSGGVSIIASVMLLAFGVSTPSFATELIRVTPTSKTQWKQLSEIAPESSDCGAVPVEDGVEFAIARAGREKLESLGFDVEVRIDNLEAHAREGIQGGGLFGLYHTYNEAITDMDALVAAHPDLISPKISIGQTIEGREIYVYKISDNPTVDENEPEIFFNAYIHAREAITFEILFGLANHLLDNYSTDADVASLVDSREIYLMPAVNPDGVEYNATTDPGGGGLWRKNRSVNPGGARGVDLNRNFSEGWGYDNVGSSGTPSSETYRGVTPFSEPETAALRDFVLSRDFSLIVNYHAYGRLEIFAPEYDAASIEDYDELLALARLRSETSNYATGPTWHVLYQINGGANDWMYSDDGKPRVLSILTEVGTSFWPPEAQINSLVAENLPGNLRLIEIADNPLQALVPAVAEVLDPGPVGRDFFVQWIDPNSDPDNPSTLWNLVEGTGHSIGADDMEGDIEVAWSADGWIRRSNRAASGQWSLLAGNGSGRNDLLESKRAYRVEAGDELTFQAWYNLETGYDYAYVEIATEARNFQALSGSITTTANPQGQNTGHGITGASGAWVLASFDLSDYVGETVWFRFHVVTDRSTAREGFYIDDVSPVHLFDAETIIASDVADREVFLSGRLDGEYAYMVQGVDGQGQGGPYSAPMDVTVATTTGIDEGPGNGSDGQTADWTGLRLLGRHPFSSQGTLAFDIPADAVVGELIELRVHDVHGKSVLNPIRGTVGGEFSALSNDAVRLTGRSDAAAGSSIAMQWRPQGTASGMYYATLRVGSRTSERQLLFLR